MECSCHGQLTRKLSQARGPNNTDTQENRVLHLASQSSFHLSLPSMSHVSWASDFPHSGSNSSSLEQGGWTSETSTSCHLGDRPIAVLETWVYVLGELSRPGSEIAHFVSGYCSLATPTVSTSESLSPPFLPLLLRS